MGRKNTSVVPGGEAGEMFFRGRSLEDDDSDEGDGIFARLLGSRKARRRKKKTRRVCAKDGDANVTYKNVSEKRRRYVIDIYTTLVESR